MVGFVVLVDFTKGGSWGILSAIGPGSWVFHLHLHLHQPGVNVSGSTGVIPGVPVAAPEFWLIVLSSPRHAGVCRRIWFVSSLALCLGNGGGDPSGSLLPPT